MRANAVPGQGPNGSAQPGTLAGFVLAVDRGEHATLRPPETQLAASVLTDAPMARPRILETYQLDVSRCIFCGICADACPYAALRCGPEFEFSEYPRDLPMLDILEMSDRERPTR